MRSCRTYCREYGNFTADRLTNLPAIGFNLANPDSSQLGHFTFGEAISGLGQGGIAFAESVPDVEPRRSVRLSGVPAGED